MPILPLSSSEKPKIQFEICINYNPLFNISTILDDLPASRTDGRRERCILFYDRVTVISSLAFPREEKYDGADVLLLLRILTRFQNLQKPVASVR